ncbi:multidrug ABC transporter [Klebsiella michiganensis]|nr:multidrug ABC transporter [Klebsiella michiganensis]
MMQLYWVALKSIWTKEIHRFMRIGSRRWCRRS